MLIPHSIRYLSEHRAYKSRQFLVSRGTQESHATVSCVQNSAQGSPSTAQPPRAQPGSGGAGWNLAPAH